MGVWEGAPLLFPFIKAPTRQVSTMGSFSEIPKTQRAAMSDTPETGVKIIEHPVVQPEDLEPGQALVRLAYSGVCHSDTQILGLCFMLNDPKIVGHEGAGEVVAINDPLSKLKVGDKVGIKFVADTCNQCEFCLDGHDMLCADMKWSGRHVDGTFQQYAVSYTSQLTPIPDGLDLAHAAPILCAGVTAYKAVKEMGCKAGDWVALPGAGGGLGCLALQYSKYMGYRTIAVDTGADKKALCETLGADAWIDFGQTDDIVKAIKAATTDGLGPQGAVITSPKAESYETAMQYIRPTGTVVAVGVPHEEAKIHCDVRDTVMFKKKLKGSYAGNRKEAIEALQIVASGKVTCPIEIRPFDHLNQTLDDLQAGKISGRVVLDLHK